MPAWKGALTRERDETILAALRYRDAGYTTREIAARFGGNPGQWSKCFSRIERDLAESEAS